MTDMANSVTSSSTRTAGDALIRFHTAVETTASPRAVFDVLGDIGTHLTWAGSQSPYKGFRLLTLDAPDGPVTVGTRWSSVGANSASQKERFYDSSVVTELVPGRRLAFETTSRLARVHGDEWHVMFTHEYDVVPTPSGSRIDYVCRPHGPVNYVPYWLKPWSKPLTRRLVSHFIRRHVTNLARMAESR
jgi:hypothetical protein